MRNRRQRERLKLAVRLNRVLNHKNCGVCNLPLITFNITAKYCSRNCKDCAKWRRRTGYGEYNTRRYLTQKQPLADRIIKITDRMNDHQKGRFADWLLRVGHKALSHIRVDEFVADWNSRGI